jgi:Glycosyl hydrolase catalytic core
MVHLEAQLTGDDWKRIQSTNQPIIHFFNEPERAGITPQHAADIWNRQMLPLRSQKGKKLVSPSCASDKAGQDWIHAWMKLVSNNPPDYLGLHYYGTDGDAAIRYLESMHQHHPRIPVIVSEFASISRQYNDVLGFTVQLANWMDGTSWIFEYALFGCMRELADGFVSPEARLMNPDGSFTDLMWKYMSDQPMHF